MKKLRLRFCSPGVQSYAYYLESDTNDKFKAKDRDGLTPWEYIQERADSTQNLSYGICIDHPEFELTATLDDVEVESIDYAYDYDEQDITDDTIIVESCTVEHNAVDPDSSVAAIVFEYDRYRAGWIECNLDVKDDFKWSDIRVLTRSLDLDPEILRDEVYLQDSNLSEGAELEVYSISYDGETYEFGYDLSFSMCDAEMQYFEKDDDGDFLQVLFSDVWDEDDDEMTMD